MKTLFKKRCLLAALTAALLISAALVVSCINQFEEQANSNIVIPKGKGLVRISVSNARTILPDSLPAAGDLYYTIDITSANQSLSEHYPADPDAAMDLSDISAPIALPADTDYEIVITAWDDDDISVPGTSANPIAGFTKTGFTVSSGSSTNLTANLTAFLDAGVSTGAYGTFTYNITVPALPGSPMFTVTTAPTGYNVKTMKIYNSAGTIVTTQANSGGTIGASGEITLPNAGTSTGDTNIWLTPGYYKVYITLTADNCQDREVENVLHIYNTKTSKWTYPVPGLSQDKFSVEFDTDLQGGETITNSSSIDISTQEDIENAGTVDNPGSPAVDSGRVFDGWFDGSTKWVFSDSSDPLPTLVFADKTLVAKWLAGTGVTIKIEFEVGEGIYIEVTPSKSGITYDDILNGGEKITFTFINTNNTSDDPDLEFTDIEWKMDGVLVGTGDTFVISSASSSAIKSKLTIGNHTINVSGKVGGELPIVGDTCTMVIAAQ